MNIIHKYGLTLRPVEKKDALFIVNLRTDPKLSRFISPTSPNIDEQIHWIEKYKIREQQNQEYYFIAQDQKNNPYGTVRLYNIEEQSFEIGSWLFLQNAPLGMAVKAHFIAYEFGFEFLKKAYSKFDIRKKNTAVLRYMNDFKTTLVREDDLNYYFILTKENFYERRSKLSIFSGD